MIKTHSKRNELQQKRNLNIPFIDYFKFYSKLGFKPILCNGYSSSNTASEDAKRYQIAKIPLSNVRGYTEDFYKSPTIEVCSQHVEDKGWVGWLVPPNTLVLDIEDEYDIQAVRAVLKEKNIQPLIHRTKNGVHILFKNSHNPKGSSKDFVSLGAKVTPRVAGKNYLILAPVNNRYWEMDINSISIDDIPPLPTELNMIDYADQSQYLSGLAYQLKKAYKKQLISGYDDIDMSFMGYLVRDLKLSYEDIQPLFETIYSEDFDDYKTKIMFDRAEEIDDIKKGGSFYTALEENKLDDALVLFKKSGKKRPRKSILQKKGFPKGLFPEKLEEIAEKISDAHSVHYEFVIMSMLTIITPLIGHSARVHAKEGFSRPIFLWKIDIADSGYGKSPVFSLLMRPIQKLQAAETEKYTVDKKRYDALKKSEQKQVPEPQQFHYFTTDFTMEALPSFYQKNDRGLLIYKDELAGLFKSLNQYKGGKGGDEQTLNQLYDAAAIKVDRVQRGTNYCKKSGASVMGGIQRPLFKETFSQGFAASGLLARFLILILKKKRVHFDKGEVTDNLMTKWERFIIDINNYFLSDTNNDITLTAQARSRLGEYIEKLNNETYHDVSEHMQYFISKMIDYLLVFIGVIVILNKPALLKRKKLEVFNLVADEKVVSQAIHLSDYFLYQASQALELIRNKSDKDNNDVESYGIYLANELKKIVKGERVKVSNIRKSLNSILPEHMEVKSKSNKMKKILEHFSLEYRTGGGRELYLDTQCVKFESFINKYK